MSFLKPSIPKNVGRVLIVFSLIIGLASIIIFGRYSSNQNNPPPEESKAATPQIVSQGASRFEPPSGKVIFGMGQNISTILPNYYYPDTKPGICAIYNQSNVRPRLLSGYVGLNRTDYLSNNLAFINKVNSEEGGWYIPIYGITGIGADFTYTDNLLAGNYDSTLRLFGQQLLSYGKPVFIRPMFEINDGGQHFFKMLAWAQSKGQGVDYARTKSLEAYRRIVDQIRIGAGGDLPNVSWIWHAIAIAGKDNAYYESWYPGNRYVDWVGFSSFQLDTIQNQYPAGLQQFAQSKGLPVIVPESGPVTDSVIGDAGMTSPSILTQYVNPTFSNIENQSKNIKAFVHININWALASAVPGPYKPDAQVQSNPVVVSAFANELKKSLFSIPSDVFKIGQKPYEMSGITAGWQSPDGALHIISRDKYWELSAANTWTKADYVQNVAPFNTLPTAARINGLAPWEGTGVTAVWFDPSENNRYLRIIGGGNRFYRYDYQTNTWLTTGNPWLDPNNNWSKAPVVNGLKPWDGNGISAVWIAPDNYMRVISKNRFYRQNLATGQWDTSSAALGVLPLGNAYWSSAPLATPQDPVQPWQGDGITAAWMKDGHILQLKSKDKYWDWDLNITTAGQNWISHGNIRDGDNTSVWKKAPFIEMAGAPQPSTNQSAACSLPATATPSPTPTGTATKTPTPTPSFTKSPTPSFTSTPSPTKTPTPTSSFTPTPTKTPTPTFSVTPSPTKSPTPTSTLAITSTNTPTPLVTTTNTVTATPSPIPGDANGDHHVDGIDYTIWLTHYGTNLSGASNGDFNTDGKVDGIDFVIWLNHYGQ